MAETKMDIEELSLETPRSASETTVKEEATEITDETEATRRQPNMRTKRESPKTKKAMVHYDCGVCGKPFKKLSGLKNHEKVHTT
ncbi:unnamed protein product, partial [Cyprideis torosa]